MIKSNNIRDYNKTRKVLENIYVYGCLSRDDFKNKNVSNSSYDKEIARLIEIFGVDEIDYVIRNKKKYYYFRRDYFSSVENYLINSYTIKSHTENEMFIIIMLLCLLVDKKGINTIAEATKFIEANTDENSEIISKRSTTKRKIEEFIEEGYVRINKCKKDNNNKGKKYELNKCILDDLDREEILDLYMFISFMSKTTYPRGAGVFLENKIKTFCNRKLIKLPKNMFLIRHNNNRNILDEEFVYILLDLCRSHKKAIIKYKEMDKGEVKKEAFCPIKLVVDQKLGRWYLKTTNETCVRFIKVRNIIEITEGEYFDYDKEFKRAEDTFGNSLISYRILDHSPYNIKVQLLFKNQGLKQQFIREMIVGEIYSENNIEIYEAKINDPVELIPWLRSFGENIKILENQCGLDKYLKKSYLEMLKNYESI